MKLNGLQLVLMHVRSIAEVQSFYADTLGFEIEDQQPGFVEFKQPGGASIAFSENSDLHAVGSTELWWYVDDVDVLHAELVARGVKVIDPPHDKPFGRALTISDPVGQPLYLLQLR